MSAKWETAGWPCLLREARAGDLAGVAGLCQDGGGVAWTAEMIAADSARTVVVATVGGELAGVAKTHHHPEAHAEAPAGHYLGGVLVARRWRRLGIGTMLTTARLD
ncbi:MAG: GNAT family N-acetyltransferase, partial [Pseudarthrobacter sp.]